MDAQNVVHELMEKTEGNYAIFDSITKAYSVLCKHYAIAVSVSGGKDSDVVVDLISRLDTEKKVKYVWFDTGLEYQATKDHIKYLEERYGIIIDRERAIKSIPVSCKQYGQPFLSKMISHIINRAQRYGFKFEDVPYEELIGLYPKSIVRWWCNSFQPAHSPYNIRRNKWLKEFMILYPPHFMISDRCCDFAKKDVAKQYIEAHDIDCVITGIRRSEGGARSIAYKTCFDAVADGCDRYRPIFWYTNADEKFYIDLFGVVNSDCYTLWGMNRTGCVGCPYNKNLSTELALIEEHEPQMLTAVNNVFKDSYEYTRMYRAFCEEMDNKYGSYTQYLSNKTEKD